MSTGLVEKEIARFLASAEPEVLCIRGKWGVGKTYIWSRLLKQAADGNSVALQWYSYVSLFGLDSLKDLKKAVFENRVMAEHIGHVPSVETLKTSAEALANQYGNKATPLVLKVLGLSHLVEVFESLSFLSIMKTIVCFDDLERSGDDLSIKNLLGLAAHLKEQKRCKVVLILNEDALSNADGEDNGKADFDRYNEKVIDASLVFAPDADYCAKIAVEGDGEIEALLRAAVVSLSISNIRVIKKIERLAHRAAALIEGSEPEVLRQAAQTLALLGRSVFSEDGPSLDYLHTRRGKFYPLGGQKEDGWNDEERKWNTLLDEYDFSQMDEFDLELLQGVQQGYFDEQSLRERAEALNETTRVNRSAKSHEAAWRLLHDSFENNEAEVLDALTQSFHDHLQIVSPQNLNSLVSLLKDLGKSDMTPALITHYVKNRNGGREFFDLAENSFGADVTDKDVRDAFSEKCRSFKSEHTPKSALLHIAQRQSWGRDHIAVLSALSPDDFYDIFKGNHGHELRSMVRAAIEFERIRPPRDELTAISTTAKEALKRIAGESDLNRRRVEKGYGVKLNS